MPPSDPVLPTTSGEITALLPGGGAADEKRGGGPLSSDDLATLNEEIAGMARAGIPLDQGLAAIAREMKRGRLQAVTRQLANDLQAGLTLPQAFEKQGRNVPPYYVAMLSAAVRSGKTNEVFNTLTQYARTITEFRSTVTTALTYPAFVLLVFFGLVTFANLFLLPKFEQIFADFKFKLPWATEVLIASSRWYQKYWYSVPAFVLFIVNAWIIASLSPSGRILRARFVNIVPVAGTLIRSARLAAFADLLGILVDQSVPLPEAFRLAAEASSDPLLTEAARQIESELLQAVPLGEALKKRRLAPDILAWMVRFGESKGNLGAALHQLADMYRRQAEARSVLLRTTLPSSFLLLLLPVIAMYVVAMLAPLLELLDALSGGGKK